MLSLIKYAFRCTALTTVLVLIWVAHLIVWDRMGWQEPPAVAGLDNAIRITNNSGGDQTNRKISYGWQFKKGEFPAGTYPKPYIAGTAADDWQSNPKTYYDDGSIQFVRMAINIPSITNGQTLVIDHRSSSDACYVGGTGQGDLTACEALALNKAGMTGFTGLSTWDFLMNLTPRPQGSANTHVVSAHDMLDDDLWEYSIKGPLLTEVRIIDRRTTRDSDYGWSEKWIIRGVNSSDTINSTTTTITLPHVPSDWASLSRPFTVGIASAGSFKEKVKICFVDSTHLYIGDNNGANSGCVNTDGRAQEGTSAVTHSPWRDFYANPLTSITGSGLANGSSTSLVVDSLTGIAIPSILRIGHEFVRVGANPSGNTLTVSHSTSADVRGRRWYNSNQGIQFSGTPGWGDRTPVYRFDNHTDWWQDAQIEQHKVLNFSFDVQFWAGESRVAGRYMIRSPWVDRQADQLVDVELETSSGTVTTITGSRIVPATMRSWPITSTTDAGNPMTWDGTAPGSLRFDFNLPYKSYVGVLGYDSNIALTSGITRAISSTTSTQDSYAPSPGWDLGSGCNWETLAQTNPVDFTYFGYAGPIWRALPGPGSHGNDLGIPPDAHATAAYAWSSGLSNADRMNEVSLGMGSCQGLIPLHWWDYVTDRYFCRTGHYPANTSDSACPSAHANYNTTAFGRILSLGSRPTTNITDGAGPPATADDIFRDHFRIGNSTRAGWDITYDGFAHMVLQPLVPYLMTGHRWYQDLLVSMGSTAMTGHLNFANQDPTQSRSHQRGQRFCVSGNNTCLGGVGGSSGFRGHARAIISLANGAFAAWDGTPEKMYLMHFWKNNMRLWLGFWNDTTTDAYIPCNDAPTNARTTPPYSPWCAGRTYYGWNAPNETYHVMWWGYQGNASTSVDKHKNTRTYSNRSPWHDGYFLTGMRQAEGFDLPYATTVRRLHQRWALNILNGNSIPAIGINPRTISAIEYAAVPCLPEGDTVTQSECEDLPSPDYNDATARYGQRYAASTWEIVRLMFVDTGWNDNYRWNDNGAPADDDSQSTDQTHGYSWINWAGLQSIADLPADPTTGATGTRAYDVLKAITNNAASRGSNVTWAGYGPPSNQLIQHVRKVGNTLHFTAPNGTPCKYVNNPSSSLDSGDSTVSDSSGREQRIDVTGLSGTIRITCYGYGRETFSLP